ncbi:MAG: DUF3787 domain-containing protein [Clostridia bacterium]|nr:DUF3787 domain-containing protein [Clostridia bacterium]
MNNLITPPQNTDGVIFLKNKKQKPSTKEKNRRTEEIEMQGLGAFRTQAISQPDSKSELTNIAMPSENNVARARNWVNENKK